MSEVSMNLMRMLEGSTCARIIIVKKIKKKAKKDNKDIEI
jgi:hypothetical protein